MANRLNTLLTSSRELSQLTRKAQQLMALQRLLEQAIPASLKRGCRVLQLERQTMTLAADNSAIAAKLRQLSTDLAAKLQEMGCEVTVIQIQVQVNVPPHSSPPKPHLLSASGKNTLNEFAGKLSDSPLKEALNRLVKRA